MRLLLLLALCALAHCARRSPSVPTIKVHHEYTLNFKNGTCWSAFGYLNSLDSPQTVAGAFPENFFYPEHAAPSRQPLTSFLPGLQTFAMNVTWQCQAEQLDAPECLLWNLVSGGSAAGGGNGGP